MREDAETMTTNYFNTFIAVAPDCSVDVATVPPDKTGTKTIARLQFELLSEHPYRFTSDDVLFEVFARRQDVSDADRAEARVAFFSKGQACLRASPLSKRYGWGTHHDAEGHVAMVAVESDEYAALQADSTLTQLQAMRSRRA